jgi:hypothetical protein
MRREPHRAKRFAGAIMGTEECSRGFLRGSHPFDCMGVMAAAANSEYPAPGINGGGAFRKKQLFSRVSGSSSKPRSREDAQYSHISRKNMGSSGSAVTGGPGPVRFPFRPSSQIEIMTLRRTFLCSYSQRQGEACSISEPISGKATRANRSRLRRFHPLRYFLSIAYNRVFNPAPLWQPACINTCIRNCICQLQPARG